MTLRPSSSPTPVARAPRLAIAVLTASASLLLTGCGGEETYTITDVRHVPASAPSEAPGRMPAGHPPVGPSTEPGPAAPPSKLAWVRPESWEVQEARVPRIASFVPKGATKTRCVVYVMGTMAGNTKTHVNRWRGDHGYPPLDDEQIQALRRIDALGRQGTLVSLEREEEGEDRDALLGFVLEGDGEVLLVKMTGPASEVLVEAERFAAFCGSLSEGG